MKLIEVIDEKALAKLVQKVGAGPFILCSMHEGEFEEGTIVRVGKFEQGELVSVHDYFSFYTDFLIQIAEEHPDFANMIYLAAKRIVEKKMSVFQDRP